MRTCSNCGHYVDYKMRFCLKKNMCPRCGSALFGDAEQQKINHVKAKINTMHFSESLSEDIIFDLSLFISNEFLKIDEDSDKKEAKDSAALEDVVETSEETLEDIRDSVRSEALESMSSEDTVGHEGLSIEETEDLRIARLKRLAKESPTSGKTGAMVRRAT